MAKHGGFPGMGMGNMQQLARQAQKLQQQMQEKQEELENRTFEATAGGGMVSAAVTGKKVLTSLTIKPEAVDPEDVEMLQDMIVAAVNEALKQADQALESTMGNLTGGLNIPGLF
ncbi:MAG: YbaB/EbfC family nucleoid-associated protein [Clostridia bacterium]|nr:YbaB/EbfC family nucleoid-associated protein [Clostridia bacterium]